MRNLELQGEQTSKPKKGLSKSVAGFSNKTLKLVFPLFANIAPQLMLIERNDEIVDYFTAFCGDIG